MNSRFKTEFRVRRRPNLQAIRRLAALGRRLRGDRTSHGAREGQDASFRGVTDGLHDAGGGNILGFHEVSKIAAGVPLVFVGQKPVQKLEQLLEQLPEQPKRVMAIGQVE